MYFIVLSGKLHKKKFHPSKLNCSSCDRFILGWPAQVFIAFHSAWALWLDRNYMKSPWYEQAKSPATRSKHTSLMSPVTYQWLNHFFRELAGSTQRSLDFVAIDFDCLLFSQLCCDFTGVVCGWREEQTDGGRLGGDKHPEIRRKTVLSAWDMQENQSAFFKMSCF